MKRAVILLFTLIALFAESSILSQEKPKKLSKISTNDDYEFIAANEIFIWISNNGGTSHDPRINGSGLLWPNGSQLHLEGKWHYNIHTGDAVFIDGLVWGGIVNDSIKVGGSTWRQGLQAGKILPNGEADNPSKGKYRVYKIRKDWESMDPNIDANDNGISDKKEYEQDYRKWPVEDGAPWIDVDKDGKFTRGIDKPEIIGDETLWFVSNDLDSARTKQLHGSYPIGIEMQTTVYAFDLPGVLGNTVFRKYKIINKSKDTVKNMFLGLWSAPELGNVSDNSLGCDSSLNLAYVYNRDNYDEYSYKGNPPALGYILQLGPVVETNNPNDSARQNDEWISGHKNLPMTSFAFAINPDATYQDAQLGTYEGSIETYNKLQGNLANGNPVINPHTGNQVKFPLSGDPINGTGWYMGEGWEEFGGAGSYRMTSSTGGFDFAPGDTQVVVYSVQIEQGNDRLESLAELKDAAKAVQQFYDRNYKFAPPIPTPELSQFTQNDSLYLYWEDNAEDYSQKDYFSDSSTSDKYNFEGYRIWQFSDSSASNPKLITSFDLENDLTEFYGIEEVNGKKQKVLLFNDTDNGLKRLYKINKDHYTGEPLQYEKEYHFGVTAFAYSQFGEYPFIESKPSIVTVLPSAEPIDEKFNYKLGESISAKQTKGYGDGKVSINVIDPSKFEADNYEINFRGELDSITYNLINTSRSDTLIKNSGKFYDNLTNRRVIDGFLPFVFNTGLDSINEVRSKYRVKELLEIKGPGGSPLQDSVNVWYHQDTTNFNSTNEWTIKARGGTDRDKFIWQSNSKDQGFGYTNYEIRFTEEGSDYYLGEIGFSLNALTADNELASDKLPFEVWDIGKTPNDPSDDKRLIIKVLDGSRFGQADSARFIDDDKYTHLPTGNYEEIYVYSDPDIDPNNLPQESGNSEITDHRFGGFVISGEMPEEGTVIRMNSYKPLTDEDVFEFTLSKPNTNDKQKAKQNINNISVYPNPFINKTAVNPDQEAKVTFTRLPNEVIVRIYTLGGTFVKRLYKNDQTERMEWDLTNSHGKLVSSGIFIAHLDMPGIGTKILKIGVVF
jgi:hypothetical protein